MAGEKPPKKPRKSTTGKRNPVADQSGWIKKKMPGRIKFDDERKAEYLEHLRETGLKYKSAELVGVSYQTVLNHIDNHPDFAADVEAAITLYTDSIRQEVRRRGRDGWDEPVYQAGKRVLEAVTDEDGNAVFGEDGKPLYRPATVRKYSDRLLELEAKRVDPAYKDKATIDLEGSGGGVLVVPAGKTTLEFMESERQRTQDAPCPIEEDDGAEN